MMFSNLKVIFSRRRPLPLLSVYLSPLSAYLSLPSISCGYTIAERNGNNEKNCMDFFGTVNKFCLQLE